MFQLNNDLPKSALSLIEGEPNLVANLANLSALIFHSMEGLNWAGFYLWDEQAKELVLGPFQGKPACLRIKPERGVCGKAYSSKEVQLVDDVHAFAGHIACDPESRSELVVPLIVKGQCVGVLDLDAPTVKRFSMAEGEMLKTLMENVVLKLWGQK